MANPINGDLVRKHLKYFPDSGEVHWVLPTSNRIKVGHVCHNAANGYRYISLFGKRYKLTHIIWLYMTDHLPTKSEVIDHRDGNTLNDKWDNLRKCTQAENMRNTKTRCDNTSGEKGVVYNKRVKKWTAEVRVKGVRHYLGYFVDYDLAVTAVRAKRKELHGEFTRE